MDRSSRSRKVGALPPAGARVLEVGCSSGGILQRFKEVGYKVRGVDLGRSVTDFGRTRHRLDLAVGTIASIPTDADSRAPGRRRRALHPVPGIKDLRAMYHFSLTSLTNLVERKWLSRRCR